MNTFSPLSDSRLPLRHDDYVQIYRPPETVPLGPIEIRATDHGLTWLAFSSSPNAVEHGNALTARCASQLERYFQGDLTTFDLPLSPRGTGFQLSVWQTLQSVPYGQTCSYREIAVAIGAPRAVRAVGAANGRNPLCLVVPCHRVIGANGKLTGYAGGLDRKRWLLQHERALIGEDQQPEQLSLGAT